MSKFDVQHSDASFRHLSSSDLVDNVFAMESLSTYHKRNHYLLMLLKMKKVTSTTKK